jgi:hypothetical protein
MVNGTPVFSLVVLGRFASDGNLVLTGTVPPGLAGLRITFRGYAVGQFGSVVATNDVPVSFH